MKKKIRKPKTKKTKSRKKYKISKNSKSSLSLKQVIKIAIAMGIGVATITQCASVFSGDKVTILRAMDKEGDEFENSIPIYDEDGKLITQTIDGSFMFFDGKYDSGEEDYIPVYALSDSGETISGYVSPDYFAEVTCIDADDLRLYNTMYKVNNSGEKVNFRTTPEMGRNNIAMKIDDGTYFLGASKLVSNKDASIWVPGLIFTEDGMTTGYVRSDCVEREDSIGIVSDKHNLVQRKRKVMEVHTSGVPLKLRTEDRDVSNNDNKLNEIPNDSIVYVVGREEVEKNGIKWTEVEYNDPNIGTVTGWVASDYLTEAKMVKKQVKKGIELRVRSKPGIDNIELARIQEGTELEIPELLLKTAAKEGDYTWVEVILRDGTRGYVATEYLEDVKEKTAEETEQIKEQERSDRAKRVEEIRKWTVVNERGNVTGMDVSFVNGENVAKILDDDNAIGDETYRPNDGIYASSDLGGKINYVLISIGAMSQNSSTIFDRDYFLDCADECEKRGIPYGFYFYSTALDEEEVDLELEFISECMDAIKPEERKYDLLPFGYDREAGDGRIEDRKLYPGIDTSEISAYEINKLREMLPYNVVLYGGGRDLGTPGSTVLDIDKVNSLLDGDPIDIWVALHRNKDGNSIVEPSQAENIDSTDSNVVMIQTILSGEVTKSHIAVDINIAEEDEYFAMLEGKSGEEIKKATENKGKDEESKDGDSSSFWDIFR